MDGQYVPLEVPASVLRAMDPRAVTVLRWKPTGLRWQFFHCMLPGVDVSACRSCHRLFRSEDVEVHVLQHSACPVCRSPHVFSEPPAAKEWGRDEQGE